MAFPVSEEKKAIFRRRLAATARELQPPTGSFAESARARQAAANDRANGIMPVRGPDQPAFSYQDHVGNNNRQLYGNSQANRGGNENAQGYVPHPSPRIPAAPVPSNGYDEPGNTPPNAMPTQAHFSVPPATVTPRTNGPVSALTPNNTKPLTVQPNWSFPPGRVPQQPDSEPLQPTNAQPGLSPLQRFNLPKPLIPTLQTGDAVQQSMQAPQPLKSPPIPYDSNQPRLAIPTPPRKLLPPPTPQDVAAISRSQAEGRGADSLREKIAGIMAAPAIQGPVMDSPQIQAMRAQKDANVRTYGSMGRSPEMQDRMESGYNKAMGIGQPTQAGEQPQSIFQRQAPPNNRMQGSVPVGPSRDMSGANGVRMGELRPNTGNVAYVPGNGTDGSVGSARYVEGRRIEPLTPGGRGTVVQRVPNGGMELIGDELTDEQRQDYAKQSARVAQSQKDRALAYKDTRALRAVGRDPKLANRPAVADALVRRAESAQGKATSLANARVAEARDRAFKDESFAREQKSIENRYAKQRGQYLPDGMTDQQVDQAEQAERQDSYDRHYGPKANGRSSTTSSGGINPANPSRQPPSQLPAGASVGMPQGANPGIADQVGGFMGNVGGFLGNVLGGKISSPSYTPPGMPGGAPVMIPYGRNDPASPSQQTPSPAVQPPQQLPAGASVGMPQPAPQQQQQPPAPALPVQQTSQASSSSWMPTSPQMAGMAALAGGAVAGLAGREINTARLYSDRNSLHAAMQGNSNPSTSEQIDYLLKRDELNRRINRPFGRAMRPSMSLGEIETLRSEMFGPDRTGYPASPVASGQGTGPGSSPSPVAAPSPGGPAFRGGKPHPRAGFVAVPQLPTYPQMQRAYESIPPQVRGAGRSLGGFARSTGGQMLGEAAIRAAENYSSSGSLDGNYQGDEAYYAANPEMLKLRQENDRYQALRQAAAADDAARARPGASMGSGVLLPQSQGNTYQSQPQPMATPISMPLQSSMYDQIAPDGGSGVTDYGWPITPNGVASGPSRLMPQVPDYGWPQSPNTENSVHGVPWPDSVPQPQSPAGQQFSPFPGARRDMLGSTQFPKLTAQQQQELLRRALQQQSQQPSY